MSANDRASRAGKPGAPKRGTGGKRAGAKRGPKFTPVASSASGRQRFAKQALASKKSAKKAPVQRKSTGKRPGHTEAPVSTPVELSGLCPVERECGACQLLSVPYEEQLTRKQASMRELFAGLADEGTVFHGIAGMVEPWHYRNKVMTPYVPGKRLGASKETATTDRSKRPRKPSRPRHEILCGMYAAGTHRVIPTDACLLENQVAKRIVLTVRDLMPHFRIEPYREDTGAGFLRHAIVRVGHESKEVLVTLVTNGAVFPGGKKFARELAKRCPEVTTIVQNVNTRMTNVVLGDEGEHVLFGPGFILDRLCGLSFRISSRSFYQVNAVQTEVLYRRAIEMAHLEGEETVIDAYCGTGTIGLVAARGLPDGEGRLPGGARVIGVDSVASAIADARANARHNGVENAEFVADDAGAFMRELAERGEMVDVLLMDPPRAGASEEFLDAVRALKPFRVVYVSCNPKTQARDAAILCKTGYRLAEVQPVDMFPHTEHVENICLFEVPQD